MTVMDLEISVGEPTVRGPLTLFPLTSSGRPAPDYLPGPIVEAANTFVVQEHEGAATVPELVVTNVGNTPVLLIEGETLLGTKQNRTLNLSVLCAPALSTPIPVSCVEAGRWGAAQPSRRSSRLSPQRMRRSKVASTLEAAAAGRGSRSDQGQVWAVVDEYAHSFAADSSTQALEEVFDTAEPRTRALVDDVEPATDQQGVLVAIDGRITGLDLFDKPSTLVAYWSGLLAGYALDAVGRGERHAELNAARDFCARVGDASVVPFDAPGIGDAGRLVAVKAFGAVRRWEDAVVHLAAFVGDDNESRGTPTDRPHRPPSQEDMMTTRRGFDLRNERFDGNFSHLDVTLVDETWLEFSTQDLGPMTAPVSPDGEYEYRFEIPAESIPELLRRLGADAGADVLTVLRDWTGRRSYELEDHCASLRTNFWCYS